MAMESFVLAGGCFWCLDAVYRTLRGVHDVVSGYTGGSVPSPSYELVCTGATGHAEAVRVDFDPDVIPREVILDVFFTLHDPTQLNRQGETQRELFEQARERAAEWWPGEVVTTIEPLGEFYDAEEYHQDFFAKNPGQGYCLAVALPKVNKIRRSYADYVVA
jgi:peptide-methionine (S)-S-oxide reductase